MPDRVLPPLTEPQRERYARQIGAGVLSEAGQRRLVGSKVLVTRAGGMGGPAALMLAMAGVGQILLAHGGELTTADLNRQVLGDEALVGRPRAEAFADTIRRKNRFVTVTAIDHEPDDAEAEALARSVDLIVSAPPTFEERLRLNRAAAVAGVPLIDAAQWGLAGTLMVLRPGQTACLACVYPAVPPFEEHFPVVGAISQAVGSLAALEAIKILSGTGQPAWGRLITYDGVTARFADVRLRRRPDCPVCGPGGG